MGLLSDLCKEPCDLENVTHRDASEKCTGTESPSWDEAAISLRNTSLWLHCSKLPVRARAA